MGIYHKYSKKITHRHFFARFSRQNAVVGVYREKSPDGTYYAYFPFGDLRDVQLMPHYQKKTTPKFESRPR